MQKVQIITTSAAELTPSQAKAEGILLIPDYLAFGPGEQYRSNMDLEPPELYRRLEAAERLPTTSHPNLSQYMDAFSAAAAAGCEEILCIILTSKMSGSYHTACSAKKLMEEQGFPVPITCYDSEQVSYGLCILVREAARRARAGASCAEIVAALDALRPHIGVYFAMPSLANARKGGRVGAIRVLCADILNVKPVLMFRDGLVRDVAIVHGFETAVDRAIDHYRTQARFGGEVFVFHAACPERAEQVKQRILAIDPAAQITVGWVSEVIGIYTGVGCIGAAFREL